MRASVATPRSRASIITGVVAVAAVAIAVAAVPAATPSAAAVGRFFLNVDRTASYVSTVQQADGLVDVSGILQVRECEAL